MLDNQRTPKTMSPSAIAANRANSQKSTGPRTAAGKVRSASNALKHGIFSQEKFRLFLTDSQLADEVANNYLEQFKPITPTEVSLTHQLIHQQLRFLMMEHLLTEAISVPIPDLLNEPKSLFQTILRELDRLPGRIQRTMKLLRAEIALRNQQLSENSETSEIEPNESQAPDPELQKSKIEAIPDTPLPEGTPPKTPRLGTARPSADGDDLQSRLRKFFDAVRAVAPPDTPNLPATFHEIDRNNPIPRPFPGWEKPLPLSKIKNCYSIATSLDDPLA